MVDFRQMPRTLTDNDPRFRGLVCTLPEDDRPTLFRYKGNIALLDTYWVGFCGTETPNAEGIAAAKAIARDIIELGYTPVSGGCPGIDTTVHEMAVELGKPTIVIVPHGLYRQYYYKHRTTGQTNATLYEQVIATGGLLLSEYDSDDTWHGETNNPRKYRWRTLERNRLIAASLAVIPVQWDSPKSGTMSTVRRAQEYGRSILIPAPRSFSPEYAGTWQYLRDAEQMQKKSYKITKATHDWMEQHLLDLQLESRDW